MRPALALGFVILPAMLGAQRPGPVLELGAGVSLRTVQGYAIGGSMAMKVNAGITQALTSRVGARVESALHFFPTASVEYAACPPTAPCESRRSLVLVASVATQAVYQMTPASWVALGPGYYVASTASEASAGGARSPSAFGIASTLGLKPFAMPLGIQVNLQYFPNGLAEIRWIGSVGLTLSR